MQTDRILMHRIFNFYYVGAFFSTRLPSVIFVEEKVLVFLILREKC